MISPRLGEACSVEADMRSRYPAWSATMAAAAAALLVATHPAAAQVVSRAAAKSAASAAAPFRTPWGDPDLQGAWTNTTTTPLERPDAFAGKAVLSEEERRDLDEQAVRNADRKP